MGTQGFNDRYEGFTAALREHGIEHPRNEVLDGGFSELQAYRVMRRQLDKNRSFSAVFAQSDEMALGVIAALEDEGLNVPLDVSVMGFDDMPGLSHQLTTIRQDIGLIAEHSLTLLQEAMDGKEARHIVVPAHLITRTSTMRLRSVPE